jgi:hypothetical protein
VHAVNGPANQANQGCGIVLNLFGDEITLNEPPAIIKTPVAEPQKPK